MLSLLEKYKLGIALELVGFFSIFIAGILAIKDNLGIAYAALLGMIVAIIGRSLVGNGRGLIQIGRDDAHSLANRLIAASIKGEAFLKDEARAVAATIKAKL